MEEVSAAAAVGTAASVGTARNSGGVRWSGGSGFRPTAGSADSDRSQEGFR